MADGVYVALLYLQIVNHIICLVCKVFEQSHVTANLLGAQALRVVWSNSWFRIFQTTHKRTVLVADSCYMVSRLLNRLARCTLTTQLLQ